jgi:hypothetical protein
MQQAAVAEAPTGTLEAGPLAVVEVLRTMTPVASWTKTKAHTRMRPRIRILRKLRLPVAEVGLLISAVGAGNCKGKAVHGA